MKLTIGWEDGEQRTLYDVTAFNRVWNEDEYVLAVTYRDGSEETYTGRKLAVLTGSEISGETQTVRTVRGGETDLRRESSNDTLDEVSGDGC